MEKAKVCIIMTKKKMKKKKNLEMIEEINSRNVEVGLRVQKKSEGSTRQIYIVRKRMKQEKIT